MRILLVEDELYLANSVIRYLKTLNYEVDTTYDGEEGLNMILENNYDIILLDVMVPHLDGFSIIKKVREAKIETPIIFTTAKSQTEDIVYGLANGADDYITKPYDLEELNARIISNMRRSNFNYRLESEEYGDITLLKESLTLSKDKDKVNLTLKEFNVLEFLVSNPNISLSKEQIIEKVWGYNSDIMPNQIEVYISYLRKKLELLDSKVSIKTIRSIGYKLEFQDV